MKKSILYLLLLVLLASFIVFSDPTDLDVLCEELLVRRAEIWNNILIEGYGYSDFYNDMTSVAAGKLLVEDLETFSYLKENPTGMERVIALEFYEESIEKQGDNAFIKGKIIWIMEGNEDTEIIESDYEITLEKHNKDWYITGLQPVE
ncbi:hypothetical protein [Lutispora sp.]|uniref:hypothetical protein n=1 Tax=Lutispora sp. TaxID=2828727 RepID=UPI0035696701